MGIEDRSPDGSWKLLVRLKDVKDGYFQPTFKSSGVENENNREANTYSIIGKINPEQYKSPIDNNFYFKLIFTNEDNTKTSIIWKQSSWPTTSTSITGFGKVEVPN